MGGKSLGSASSSETACSPSGHKAGVDVGLGLLPGPPGAPAQEGGEESGQQVSLTTATSRAPGGMAVLGRPSVADHVVRSLVQHRQVAEGSRKIPDRVRVGAQGGSNLSVENSAREMAELVRVRGDHCSGVAAQHGRVGGQVPETIGIKNNWKLESFDPLQDESQPTSHALVASQAGAQHDTVEPRKPVLDLLEAVLLVKHGVHNQLGAVASHHRTGLLLTEDVHQIRTTPEGGDGSKVGGSAVHDTTAKDSDPSAFPFAHR